MTTFNDLFARISSELTKDGGIDVLSSQFAKLSNNVDRIKFVSKIPSVLNIARAQENFKSKSVNESEKHRSRGNGAFQRSEYFVALYCYTLAVMYAPPDSHELSLAFANRSAVLLRFDNYLECLKDIDRALENNYPDDLRYKLLERKGKCHIKLGNISNALLTFNSAVLSIDASILREDKRTSLRTAINEIISRLENSKDESLSVDLCCKNDNNLPVIEGARSLHFPCASDAFSLSFDVIRGRYPIATRDIHVGEIIIIEEPFSSVLFPQYYSTHCHNCCRRIVGGVPCHQCSAVIFCDAQCRDVSWNSYHYAECRYLKFLEELDLGMPTLALRMVLQTGAAYIAEFCSSVHDQQSMREHLYRGFGDDLVYGSRDYNAAFHLVDHSTERSVADLFRRSLQAVILLDVLKRSGGLTGGSSRIVDTDSHSDDYVAFRVGGCILRHILMLPCNAHEITEYVHDPSDVIQSENVEIGSALYTTLSLINHSCDPAVVRVSYGNRCVVRAIRPLRRGDEISDSYSTLYATSTKEERQSHLATQYFFSCACQPCIEDWPLYRDLPSTDDPQFRCDACGRTLSENGGDTSDVHCPGCDASYDLREFRTTLVENAEKCDDILEEILAGKDGVVYLPFLRSYLEMIHRRVVRPWKRFSDAQEISKQIFSAMGNHSIKE